MMSTPRARLLAELLQAHRQAGAQTVLFSQAVAGCMDVHPTDLETLEILARRGRLSAGQLAEESGRSTAGVTSLIDRLETKGFASRVRDPFDRRKVFVEIDQELADSVVLPLYGGLSEGVADLVQTYSDDEVVLIRDFLRGSNVLLRRETDSLRQHKSDQASTA